MKLIMTFYTHISYQEGRRTVPKFVRDYLGNDGIFLLRILATNTNDVVMAEMVCSLWLRYVNYENKVVEHPSKPTSDATDDLEMEELKPSQVVGSGRNAGMGDGADKSHDMEDPSIAYSSGSVQKGTEDPLHIA